MIVAHARTALPTVGRCLLLSEPPAALAASTGSAAPADTMMADAMPNAVFTLRTGIAQGKMVYIGKGGDIDGKVNPTLAVHEGDLVQTTPVNGEGAEHDIVLPDLRAASQRVSSPGEQHANLSRGRHRQLPLPLPDRPRPRGRHAGRGESADRGRAW